MDKGKLDNAGSEGEESEKYLWLAALIIGILLILMLLAIAGIVIWKHFKKEDTADQNWAGPSPLADGNIHEDLKINECILGRQRSLSSLSTAPIVLNEVQDPQKGHVNESMPQEHSEVKSMQEDDHKKNTPTLPYISSEKTSFSSDAPERKQCQQNLDSYSLKYQICLPPPPDDLLQFPMPPPINESLVLEESNMQPLALTDVPQSDEHHQQISLHQENSMNMTDPVQITCDPDYQLLPPPPADLL